jgi:hypothetical protein
VSTWTTPGTASAASVRSAVMRACACGACTGHAVRALGQWIAMSSV